MSKDLEMMAEMMGEDIDQIKRNLTEISPEELEKKKLKSILRVS